MSSNGNVSGFCNNLRRKKRTKRSAKLQQTKLEVQVPSNSQVKGKEKKEREDDQSFAGKKSDESKAKECECECERSPVSTIVCSSKMNSSEDDDWEALADALEAKEKQKNVEMVCKAWQADDASRPQSLPKPNVNPWPQQPCCCPCPVCFEDLDSTDASFLPCPCGFHLCLFCYKTILEGDGRCPACRKDYNP